MASTVGPQTAVYPADSGTSEPASHPWRWYWKDILWAARLTVGAVCLLAGRAWPSYRHQMVCILVLVVLAGPVRSVRWGTLYNFFLIGFFFSFPIVGVQYFVEKILLAGQSPLLGSVLVAPITEEIGKVLPLVLLLAIGRLGFRISYGACDLMLCGAALGGGFGLVEDSLRVMTSFPKPASPILLGIAVFPDSYGGFIGHPASAAVIGLSLGYLLYAVRWRRWFLPGVGAMLFGSLWMMVDHGLANYSASGSQRSWFFLIRWIWVMDRRGELSPYVFLILIVSTVVTERLLLWRFLRGYPHLSIAACFDFVTRPLQHGWGYPQLRSMVMRMQSLSLYVLSYRRLAFLLIHWKGDLPANRTIFGPLLARFTGKVAMSQIAVRQS